MSRTARKAVLVFTKAPRPGRVKTRLVPVLGANGAAALQRCLIEHTMRTARAAEPDLLELHVDDPNDAFVRSCAARYRAELVPQTGPDLGARMFHAFQRTFERGLATAVLAGSDCPALEVAHLHAAQAALDRRYDAVFAPAEDGGYVLIGLTRVHRLAFENVAWGTHDVMSCTRARLRALRWSWLELDTLWDVDRPADLDRLARTDASSSLVERFKRQGRGYA